MVDYYDLNENEIEAQTYLRTHGKNALKKLDGAGKSVSFDNGSYKKLTLTFSEETRDLTLNADGVPLAPPVAISGGNGMGSGGDMFRSTYDPQRRNQDIFAYVDKLNDKTRITQYTEFSQLGLTPTATYEEIFNAMEKYSVAILNKVSTVEQPQTPVRPATAGILLITKHGQYRSEWRFLSATSNSYCREWIGSYIVGISPEWTGWKEVITDYNYNTIAGIEQGIWTPAITSSGGGTATLSMKKGRYVKQGKNVTLTFALSCSSISNLRDGAIKITGLPFATSEGTTTLSAVYGLSETGKQQLSTIVGVVSNNAITLYSSVAWDKITDVATIQKQQLTDKFRFELSVANCTLYD